MIGLVGLVSYSAEQRKKEIGIRKVFGASFTGIYIMINTQYVRLLIHRIVHCYTCFVVADATMAELISLSGLTSIH